MIWVSWRQQRTETVIAAAILALLAALLIPTGIEMARAFDHDGLSACLGQVSAEGCGGASQSFSSRFEPLSNLTAWFTLLPGLVGALFAAPFVFEFETGTFRLAWTQSITRRRWIATKLGLTIAAALAVAGTMILLITWWRTPFVRLNGRMENSAFDFEGTVALGYVAFALGLALAVGVVWRRTVAALIVAFVGYAAARIFVDTWLRQRFEAPVTATWRESVVATGAHKALGRPPKNLEHAWVLDQYPSDRLGRAIHNVFGPCLGSISRHAGAINEKCLTQKGAFYSHAIFQPASRFWHFQLIETGLFGGCALLLIAFAAWWAHERTG